MKTVFNPNIAEVDFRIITRMDNLTNWDFEHIIENELEKEDQVTREEIEEGYWVKIFISGSPDDIRTTYEVLTWDMVVSRISTGAPEETGDNEATVEDVVFLLENKLYESYSDHSVDNNDCYYPAFVGFETMETK
jgi:hypothetical protein